MIAHLDTVTSRITPAYAGTRTIEQLYDMAVEDHPRIRGDKVR